MNTSSPLSSSHAPSALASSVATGGLTGTQLKILAIVTMFIDHSTAVLLEPLSASGSPAWLPNVSMLLRGVGRLAFPIFCFLLVEGFLHTHSAGKYLLRLSLFALLSELPFDLALNGASGIEFSGQNVFFTLALGLAAMWAIQSFTGKAWLQVPLALLCVAGGMILRTDYGAMGVVLILIFYLLRHHHVPMFIAAGVWLFVGITLSSFVSFLSYLDTYPMSVVLYSALLNGLLESVGALSIPFLAHYNGQRGQGLPKYFFYAFYPVHLLCLWGIAKLCGIA